MIQLHITSVIGPWEAGFAAAHVDEWEGRPSSRFRCERCHSYERWQNMHRSSSTDTRDVKQVLKDIQLCIHAATDPERATQTLFSTTHHYFCVTDI